MAAVAARARLDVAHSGADHGRAVEESYLLTLAAHFYDGCSGEPPAASVAPERPSEAPEPRATSLSDLPPEMAMRVLVFLPAATDIAACLRTARLFVDALGTASAAVALERRAIEAGEPVCPPEDWAGTGGAWLVWCERRRRAHAFHALVAAGTHHTAFVDTEGLLTCGINTKKLLLGRAGAPYDAATHRPAGVAALRGVRIVAVAASETFSLSLAAGGALYSWGCGSEGQLGLGDENDRATPCLVEALEGEEVVAVAAGDDHALAATADGALYSWGYGVDGRLGHEETEGRLLPERVEALADVRVAQVAAGRWHSLALCAGGALYSWGGGMFGRLGHGDEESQTLPRPVAALSAVRVVSMSASAHHTLAVCEAGEAYSWGYGGNGRLGHGDTANRSTPTRIESLRGERLVSIAAGFAFSLGVTEAGAVLSWGANECGQLGHRDRETRLAPAQLKTLQHVRIVAATAGKEHAIAIADGGKAFGWGCAAQQDPRLGLGASNCDLLMPRPYSGLRCTPAPSTPGS
jgi:alpha-tubulin suppressor-like RCC1 family protein